MKKKKGRCKKNLPPQEELADLGWNEEGGCNGEYAYIAGFTSGGAPFGVTWEEMGESPPWAEDEEEEIPL